MASTVNTLHQAVVGRDFVMIDRILKICDGWKAIDDEGETMLHLAFKNKEKILDNQQTIIQTLQLLLDEGLSVNIKNAVGRTVLFLAVEDRLQDVIDFLINCGADLDARDQNGNSIVHFLIQDQLKKYAAACIVDESLEARQNFEHEDIDFMIWLLSKGINVDCKNNDGNTALHLAIACNLQHVMPILIKHMNNVHHIDENGRTLVELFFRTKISMNIRPAPLPEYVYSRLYGSRYCIDIVKFLLDKGVSVDHVDNKGNTLVHTFLSLYDENPEIIRWMLQRCTKVNARDVKDRTALHLVIDKSAGWNGQYKKNTVDFVRMLLSKGARTDLKDKFGNTPVSLAVREKHIEVLRVLSDHGVNLGPSKNPGYLLHDLGLKITANTDDAPYAAMVDMLVRAGWDVNFIRPCDLYSPLLEACRYSSPAIAQKLIDNGANVHYAESEFLMRPMQTAACWQTDQDTNVIALFKMLVKAGADVNVKNIQGETALHVISSRGYLVYKTLLGLGADVEVRDDLERSLLCTAVENGNFEGIRALLEFGADVNDEFLLMELEMKIKKSNEDVAVDCVMKHWLKLKAMNLPVMDEFEDIAKKMSLQQFYKECLEEVEGLKAYYLDDRTTLYHMLHMDVRERCVFIANNEELKNLVDTNSLESSFPKYEILILSLYKKAMARYPLIEPARRAWYRLTEIDLPDVCVTRILRYLNNKDLKLMAEEDDEIKSSLKRMSQLTFDEVAKKKRLT